MEVTIKLPETFEVMSRGETVTVKLDKLNAEIMAQAALHGLKQKIADAAAGAVAFAADNDMTKEEASVVLMDKATSNLYENGWTATRSGGSADPLVPYLRKLIMVLLNRPEAKDKLAEYKALETPAEKNKYRDDLAANHPQADDLRKLAQAEKDKADAAKKAQKEMVADIEL